MVKLYEGGAYLVHGTEIVPEDESAKVTALTGKTVSKEEAKKGIWRILFWKHTTLPAIWTN